MTRFRTVSQVVSAVALCSTLQAFGAGGAVGLVLDKGGKDDKSFNAAAFAGMEKCSKELGVKLKMIEAPDDNAFEQLHTRFAQDGKYQLVVGVGFAQKEAVAKVAARFPKVNFALVDDTVTAPNVRSLLFQEHEGSFLVGALAALVSKTGKVGFVGGQDSPIIRRFQMGYEAGARHVRADVGVSGNFVGVTPDAWKDPGKAKELALAQFAAGADVIFTAAGASGLGVFDAAEEKKKFAIGVDSNQNWIKPGIILSSMLKRVDVAVYNACRDAVQGKFTAGVERFGLANNGVDYAVDKYNEKLLSANVRKRLETLRGEIVSGKIKVPDYYVSGKK